MADANKRDPFATNPYDGPNPFEDPSDQQTENFGYTVPARLPQTQQESWRARNTPTILHYQPILGDTSRRRRQAKQFIDDVALANTVADAITGFTKSAERLEDARQDLELAHERRKSVPFRAEQQRLALTQELVAAHKALEEAVDGAAASRVARQRQRQINADFFEIAILKRDAEKLEARALKAAAEAQLEFAEQVGKQRGEADLFRAEGDSLRNQAAAEVERRRLDEARQKRTDAAAPVPENGEPPEFAAFDATGKRARMNRKWGEELAAQIRARGR